MAWPCHSAIGLLVYKGVYKNIYKITKCQNIYPEFYYEGYVFCPPSKKLILPKFRTTSTWTFGK